MNARQIVNALLEDDFDPEEVEQVAATPRPARDRILHTLDGIAIAAHWHSPFELDAYIPHRFPGKVIKQMLQGFDPDVSAMSLDYRRGEADDLGYRVRYWFPRLRGYSIYGKVLPPIPA